MDPSDLQDSKSSNYFGNALQLAVSTALQFVNYDNKKEKEHMNAEEITNNSLGTTTTIFSDHLREINLDQVSWHDQFEDCWVILYDRVYDVTEFLQEHPGGADVLLEYAGRDATLAYRGFGHSAQAWKILQKYLIGVLPEKERMQIFKPCEMETHYELKAAIS